MAHAYVSTLSWPDTVRKVGSEKKSRVVNLALLVAEQPATFLLAVSISASSPFSLSMASTAGLTRPYRQPP